MIILKVALVWYSVIALSGDFSEAAGAKCYQCSHVAHPRDCNRIVECKDGEVCHVVSYAQPDGHFYYTIGCLAKDSCPRGHAAIGKRDIAFCNRCCEGNYCNRELCDGPAPAAAQGPRCLQCDTVMHPTHCGAVTQCQAGQKCFTREIYPFGERRYQMGCATDAAGCSPLRYRSLIGKRAGCTECCTGENCNRELCSNTGSPQTSAPGTIATRIPVTVAPAASNPPTQQPTGLTTRIVVRNGCLYKGKLYNQDQTFRDGCLWDCTCVNASIGQLACQDVCPTYTHIPSYCNLVKKPGECCSTPDCHGHTGSIHTSNFTSNVLNNECFFQGKRYKQDETWRDGCDYECICSNASKGFYNCTSLCYHWTLPQACHMDAPAAGKCCQTPWCPAGYKINYPDGYVVN